MSLRTEGRRKVIHSPIIGLGAFLNSWENGFSLFEILRYLRWAHNSLLCFSRCGILLHETFGSNQLQRERGLKGGPLAPCLNVDEGRGRKQFFLLPAKDQFTFSGLIFLVVELATTVWRFLNKCNALSETF